MKNAVFVCVLVTIVFSGWTFAATKAGIIPSQFCPANAAVSMPISGITLAWYPGQGAVSHDVYFGTTNPPAFQSNVLNLSFPLTAALIPNTTYYWRIDEKDASGGTTTGDVWTFTTGNPVGIYPYLTWRGEPTTTITVNWWNPAAEGDSSVDYGLDDSYGSTANVATPTRYHHVEITGLTENTTYHYQIRSTDGTIGSDNTFKTAPALKTRSFKFAFYGDPRTTELDEGGIYSTRQKALCDWLSTQDIAFAIEGGDTVWEGASLRSLGKYWPDWFRLESDLTKSKVVMHTLGGHDVQGGGSYYYWEDFYTAAFPNTNSSIAGNNGKVYSFDYANAHFVCLSTYNVNLSEQTAWLSEDLAAARARGALWIFVWFHDPMFTTSGHAGRQNLIQYWGPIFDQYKVNCVFQCHNHLYERFYPLNTYYDGVTDPCSPVWTGKIVPDGEGTVYVTNGAGGAEFNNGDLSDPKLVCWYGGQNLNTTVATIVTVNEDIISDFELFPRKACRVQTIRNDTDEVIDSFELFAPLQLLPGDYNRDGIIDTKDLGIFAGHWLDSGLWP